MENKELLDAIRQIIHEELTPVYERLDIIDIKQGMTHKKIDDIELNMKISERAIRKDIALLKDAEETLITVMEAKGILPKVEGQ